MDGLQPFEDLLEDHRPAHAAWADLNHDLRVYSELDEYMFTMLCITSDKMKTLPVAIGQMASYDKIMWNDLMAASLLSSLPVVVMFIFLQRYFISSMTQGAVKG